MIVFDIETGPRPREELLEIMPQRDWSIEPFDESQVKLGNLKDPAKIEAKIAAARAEHEAFVAGAADRKAVYEQEFIDDAALSAVTGVVLAVGYRSEERTLIYGDEESEPAAIACFWKQVEIAAKTGESIVGFNIFGFDLPFLIRRSFALRLSIPPIFQQRRWHPCLIDLLDVWRCGDRSQFIKLDELARLLGLAGKPDGVTGADFARLWVDDRPAALSYLANDLRMTWEVAEAMQVL